MWWIWQLHNRWERIYIEGTFRFTTSIWYYRTFKRFLPLKTWKSGNIFLHRIYGALTIWSEKGYGKRFQSLNANKPQIRQRLILVFVLNQKPSVNYFNPFSTGHWHPPYQIWDDEGRTVCFLFKKDDKHLHPCPWGDDAKNAKHPGAKMIRCSSKSEYFFLCKSKKIRGSTNYLAYIQSEFADSISISKPD